MTTVLNAGITPEVGNDRDAQVAADVALRHRTPSGVAADRGDDWPPWTILRSTPQSEGLEVGNLPDMLPFLLCDRQNAMKRMRNPPTELARPVLFTTKSDVAGHMGKGTSSTSHLQ
ncbi:hypothetical protein CLCR_09300 [Cladophialophora carrionii]|uniref:Uncharacterized protein n=1 Tax=Cladophialophora carrionii TaxID=86049 RepID=A0A1C1CT06_9EURO|nr:hypothetical protein CLCR_09300 [Cladophialophora carrionii]